jgi:hypothetical protein
LVAERVAQLVDTMAGLKVAPMAQMSASRKAVRWASSWAATMGVMLGATWAEKTGFSKALTSVMKLVP